MDSLPNEMLFAISNYLNSKDQKTLRFVNPIWQEVATEQLTKILKPKFYNVEHLKNFCSTFTNRKTTNLYNKFNNFTFGFVLLQSSEAFAPISTFCKYFGTNVTKLDINLYYVEHYFPSSCRESPIILSKVIGKLLTAVTDTVRELRLKNYNELNDHTWTMATFQALESLELLYGKLLVPSPSPEDDNDGDNFIIALSKNVPRIRHIHINDTVSYRAGPSSLLPLLRNVTTNNPNVRIDLSFVIINNTDVTTLVEDLTSIPGLNVTKLEFSRKEYQIGNQYGLSLPMLLHLFSTLTTTLRHLILLGFHQLPFIGDLPSLPNLETLEYYQNHLSTVFEISACNGYPNLTTVITSYFSNDFLLVIPSVKILKLYDANGHRNHAWTGVDIYETGLETWGNRLAFAFPNVNYLSCGVRCIQHKFVFKFQKLKILKLESLDYDHVKRENDKIETNYYWNLFTQGLQDLTFKEIYKTPIIIEGMETQYPVQRPFFGDLKELEVLETISMKPGMPIIKALIYLSQIKELPRLKKLKSTLIPNGDYYRSFGKYLNVCNPIGTIIYKNETEYLKKFHDNVELTLSNPAQIQLR